MLFFTDAGPQPWVGMSNLDGSAVRALVTEHLVTPTGIAVDYLNQRVYYADSKRRTVEAVRYGIDTHKDGPERNAALVKQFERKLSSYCDI